MKTPNNVSSALQQTNELLESCTDKDWNYSRIRLFIKPLSQLHSPYALWIERVEGEADLRALRDEVAWGSRHSDELGILEIVSLRINKAILQALGEKPSAEQPVLRIVKKQELESHQITEAFWYEIQEVSGEDFENR